MEFPINREANNSRHSNRTFKTFFQTLAFRWAGRWPLTFVSVAGSRVVMAARAPGVAARDLEHWRDHDFPNWILCRIRAGHEISPWQGLGSGNFKSDGDRGANKPENTRTKMVATVTDFAQNTTKHTQPKATHEAADSKAQREMNGGSARANS